MRARKEGLSRPIDRRETEWVLWGIGLGAAAVFFHSIRGYPTAIVLFSALFFQPICVILHELGHAWGTSLVGGGVRYIQLGKQRKDRQPRRVRLLGYTWVLYALPFSGLVQSDIFTTRYYRLKRCFLIAAGPAFNALLLIFAWLLADRTESQNGSSVWVGLIFANATILFYSVPPRTFPSGSIVRINDGLLIYQTIRYTDEDIRIHVAQSEIARRFLAEARELGGLTLSELIIRHEATPDSLAVLWFGAGQLHHADDPRYADLAVKLIDHPDLSRKHLPIVIDEYLTWQLNHGSPAKPERADQLSAQLLEIEKTISARGTRGAVLVDIGRIEEGREMLKEVLAKSKSVLDQTYSNIFLALAYKAEGDLDLARDHARAAAMLTPTSPALGRIAELLKDEDMHTISSKCGYRTNHT